MFRHYVRRNTGNPNMEMRVLFQSNAITAMLKFLHIHITASGCWFNNVNVMFNYLARYEKLTDK